MEKTGGQTVTGTVKFIRIFDRWFDCLNVRSYREGFKKLKPDCEPYTDEKDLRFKVLLIVTNL